MRNYILIALVMVIFNLIGCASKSNTDAEKAAIQTTQVWLELIDSEKYTES